MPRFSRCRCAVLAEDPCGVPVHVVAPGVPPGDVELDHGVMRCGVLTGEGDVGDLQVVAEDAMPHEEQCNDEECWPFLLSILLEIFLRNLW